MTHSPSAALLAARRADADLRHRLVIRAVDNQLDWGDLSDLPYDVRSAGLKAVSDAVHAETSAARAHLRSLLGDWCESYGWPRNTPEVVRRAAAVRNMHVQLAAAGRVVRRFREAIEAAAVTTQVIGEEMTPADRIMALIERQESLEQELAENRNALARVLSETVLQGRVRW